MGTLSRLSAQRLSGSSRMGRRTVLLAAGLAPIWSTRLGAHPAAVSFSELHHRPDKGCIECSLRAKAEDLEHVARVMSGLPLRYGGKGFAAWIVAYLRRVILLRGPDGQVLDPLVWVGSEEDGAFVWLYFKLPTTKKGQGEYAQGLEGYFLSQGYMLGVVPYQVNTVVLHRGTEKNTLHYQEDSARFLEIGPLI